MPLTSDLKLDVSKLDPKAISEKTAKLNDGIMKAFNETPKWWEVGAARFREMRWNGETPAPKAVVLDAGQNISIPSRDSSRSIPCRVFAPEHGAASSGVILHIHGGGWVLQSEKSQDPYLQNLATRTAHTVVSVGYRLAPEHPYPAGNEDCYDVGMYLVDHSVRDFGVPLGFITGDSAGGQLSALTVLKLRELRPQFEFKGCLLNYGAYDLAGNLPMVHHFDLPLFLTKEIMDKFIEAYQPNTTIQQRQDPWISPFYAELSKVKLPPALFSCGTLDLLLDDSVAFSTKWAMSGAESILKLYPGAPHGFTLFSPEASDTTSEALDNMVTFVKERS